jgi:predicted dithiol-disulfide oxidoreductase (DUF899 family)
MWAGAPDHAANAKETVMSLPRIATREAWLAARKELLAKEKDLTRLRDELNAERRDLPMVAVEKDYIFDGPNGTVRLIDLFEGRPQLIIYHFMFDPGWEDGCPSCTAGTDELSAGFFAHLHTRDTSYAMVSRAPLAKLERWKAKKGWDVPWYSSFGTDFNYDFGVTIDESAGRGEYNFRTKAEFEALGRTSSPQTSPSRCRAGAASSKPAGGCSTPTPSTPAAWSPPAAPTTSSTSPRSAGKRSGRNPRDAASPQGPPRPTSRPDRPPGTSSADVRNAHLASWTSNS